MDSGSVMPRPTQRHGTVTMVTQAWDTVALIPLATPLLPQSTDTLLDTPPDMATVMVSGSVMLRPTLRLSQRPGTATMATLALLATEAPTPLATQLLPQSTDTLLDTPPDMATVMDSGSVMLRPNLRPSQRPGTATTATLALLAMEAPTPLATQLLPQSMDTLATEDMVPASGSVRP